MNHRLFLATILFVALLRVFPSSAQNVTWLAWTYDDRNGEMIQLDSTGFTRFSAILPTMNGYDYPANVAVSPQGTRVAYTLTSANGDKVFTVYDPFNFSTVMSYTVIASANTITADSLTYNATPHIFSQDGSRVAFAYTIDTQSTLLVFDLNAGGQIIASITTQTNGEIPVPMWLDGIYVDVVMTPLAAGGFGSLNSAVWDYSANTLVSTRTFPTLSADIEPRMREIIYPALDTRFPERSAETMMGIHFNSVQVNSPNVTPSPFPFYVDSVNSIDSAHFVQNGERLLLQVSQIDGDSYGSLVLVERSGAQVAVLPFENLWIDRILGIGDGFVFSAATTELERFFPQLTGANSTAVVYVPTASASPARLIYTGVTGTTAKIVWAQDVVARPLPNSNAWGQVGVTTAPPIAPTAQSVGLSDALTVGGWARVTLEGDGVSLRDAPSTRGALIAQLNPLDILDVVGGSVIADGYVWWQLSDGAVTGWAAAGDTGELWLEVYTGGTFPSPGTGLAAPNLLSPQTNTVFYAFQISHNGQPLPPVFEWTSVNGAAEYVLEFERCTGMIEANCTPIMAFYTPLTSYSVNLLDFGFDDYRWRVVAQDSAQNSAASEWRYVTLAP